MKLWFALSLAAIFGCSVSVLAQDSTSFTTSSITLLVKVYRTIGKTTTLQQFNITLNAFSSILQKLSDVLKTKPNNPTNSLLSRLTTNLQQLITKIAQNPSDETSIRNLSSNLLQLINTLRPSQDPELMDILKLIETSFASEPEVVPTEAPATTPSPPTTKAPSVTSAATKATPPATAAPTKPTTSGVVVIDVNITANAQVDDLINTLTTFVKSSTDPNVNKIINQIIDLLKSYSKTKDQPTLVQILQLALQLLGLSGPNNNLSGVVSTIVAFVVSALGAPGSNPGANPLSQLIAFLISLAQIGSLTPTQANNTINMIPNNGTDNSSLLPMLITVLQSLQPRIPSEVAPTYQALLDQLKALAKSLSPTNIANTLSALQNLVTSVLKYTGADQQSLIDILRLIITVLLTVLEKNPQAVSTLQSLLAMLTPTAATTASPKPTPMAATTATTAGQKASSAGMTTPRAATTVTTAATTATPQPQPTSSGCSDGLLGSVLCLVNNLLVGPDGQQGVVGAISGLTGGGSNGSGSGGNNGIFGALQNILNSIFSFLS